MTRDEPRKARVGSATPRASTAPLPALRAGTADLHRVLDQQSILSAWLTEAVSVADYRQGLAALLAVYRPVDRYLSGADHLRPGHVPAYSPRTPLLIRDLQVLGAGPAVAGSSPDFQPTWIRSPSAYAGARYVVEGAQLGSLALRQALRKGKSWPALEPASHFLSSKPDRRGRGPVFYQHLEFPGAVDDVETAVDAARQVFCLFIDHLCSQESRS